MNKGERIAIETDRYLPPIHTIFSRPRVCVRSFIANNVSNIEYAEKHERANFSFFGILNARATGRFFVDRSIVFLRYISPFKYYEFYLTNEGLFLLGFDGTKVSTKF